MAAAHDSRLLRHATGLADLVVAAGCELVASTQETQTWRDWDPDTSPAPLGCFSMESVADDLVASGQLLASDREALLSTIHAAARRGAFSMRLTMFGVTAIAPPS